MRPAVVGVVAVLAVVAAGGTFFFLENYLDSVQNKAATLTMAPAPKPSTLNVLVSSTNIEAGKLLDPSMFEWQQWPDSVARDAAAHGVVVSSDEGKAAAQKPFEGAVTRISIIKGEPLTDDKVAHLDKGSSLSVVLEAGHRSMTIGVDPLIGAGGMVQPGDHVDIVLTTDLTDAGAGTVDVKTATPRPKIVTETLLQNVRVISVDRRLSPVTDPAVPPPTNVTFDVTPEQAEKLIVANRVGRFTLTMRPLVSGQDPVRTGLAFTTDTYLMPDVVAARRGVPVSRIDPRENPFSPPPVVVADVAPAAAPVAVPPPAPVVKKEPSIVVYRYTTPTVVRMDHGRAVVDGQDVGAPLGSAPSPRPSAQMAPAAAPPSAATPAQPAAGAGKPAAKPGDNSVDNDAYYGAVPINRAAAAFTGNTTGSAK